MKPKQLELDFNRAEQLGLIDRVQIPKQVGVSPAACKAVLRVIDSFGRGRECWPSERSIAAAACLSLRTTKRAIRALESLSILCIERRGVLTLNHYRIVWSELGCLTVQHAVPSSPPTATASPQRRDPIPRDPIPAGNEVPPWHLDRGNEVPRCHNEVPSCPNEVPPWPPTNVLVNVQGNVTNQRAELVELVFLCGVKKASDAIDQAFQIGLHEDDIRQRVDRWRSEGRPPGHLFRWMTMRGSYELATQAPASTAEQPTRKATPVRGDALTPQQQAASSLRYRIFRQGRAAGWSAEEIDRRCQQAGV